MLQELARTGLRPVDADGDPEQVADAVLAAPVRPR
jgi:hypothetical protein